MGDQQAAPPLSTKLSARWPCSMGPGQSEGPRCRRMSQYNAANKARAPESPGPLMAMGRIEHTLLVGGWRHLNRPKTFAHFPLNPTIPQKLQMFLFTTKGRSPQPGSSDPMREAGAPSTGEVVLSGVCPSHRG
jgi:hypothetical protein